jgi:urease accessory protein
VAIITTEPALLRLLQLSSVGLPVGGFAYSQGLEHAIDAGWVKDAAACEGWLDLQLRHALARLDLAVVFRLYRALGEEDGAAVCHWNDYLLACRETRELYLTDTAMGQALKRLLGSLGMRVPGTVDTSFVTAFSSAAWQWGIDGRACALALAWSWLENQAAAATKLIPLGQTRTQQMLGALQAAIPDALDTAGALNDDSLGAGLPALALASTLHETQYSRLFRS